MGFALKGVANREWGVLGGRQSIGRGKLRANITACIADHLGMVFEPELEAFFQLATDGLADMSSRARLEARYPPRNRAPRNFKQIDAFDSWCDHKHPLLYEREMKRSHDQSACNEERNLHPSQEVYQMESAFPRNISTSAHDWGQVLMFEGESCSHFRAFTTSR